jgi:hypothetical protein
MGKGDKKYVGKLERVLLIRVTLPPFDKFILFQLANQCYIISVLLLKPKIFVIALLRRWSIV